MPSYLVRIRENREGVGFFAVEDLDDLLVCVDEVLDPATCEYAEIGSGSVVWEGGAMRVPAPDFDWDNERRSMLVIVGTPSLGGNWVNALMSNDLKFTPFVGDAQFKAR
jgi:hypothetical protein